MHQRMVVNRVASQNRWSDRAIQWSYGTIPQSLRQLLPRQLA